MIDEKKLMKVIEVMVKPLTTPDGCGRFDSEIQAYNEGLIDAMEKVNEQPKVGEWIPCSERLPVPNEFDETGHFFKAYLVQAKNKTMYTALWDGKWWTIWTRGTVIKNVVAWMPLPEPYKVGDQE